MTQAQVEPQIHHVAGLNLLLTEYEGRALSDLVVSMGRVDLKTVIEADANGLVVGFRPVNGMSWDLVFFIQNLMIAQRLHLVDEMLKKQGVIK